MIDMLQKFDRSSLKSLEPKNLVLARCEAFRRNDFEFVFFSYHADAPFLQAFPDCRDYVQYAEQTLQDAFTINACRVARARQVAADEVQVLFMMEIECEGTVQKTMELACLKRTEEGWRYHSGAKRPLEEFSCPIEDIAFEDFLDSKSLVFF